MTDTERDNGPGYPAWAQPDAAVAFSRVVHEFVNETLGGGADADCVMLQAQTMLGAWLIARGLDEPGYGGVRWSERALQDRLAHTQRRLRAVRRELTDADADRKRLQQAQTELLSALTEIAQHQTAGARPHRCTGRCAHALIARAKTALTHAQQPRET